MKFVLHADGSESGADTGVVVPWWSFTKTQIAALVLTLVRDRSVSLDDPLPDQPFSLRELLQHRAGLVDYGLCTRCEVVEESATHLVREATIAGDDLREIISFAPEHKVTFFQANGPREGAIVNELFEDESGALQLRFYCYLGLRGKAPDGPEEKAEQQWMSSDKGYETALLSTLKRTRELFAGTA